MRDERGFALAELPVAMAVLGVGLVADASQNLYAGSSDGVGPFFGGGEQAALAFRTPDLRKSYLVQEVRGFGQRSSHQEDSRDRRPRPAC